MNPHKHRLRRTVAVLGAAALTTLAASIGTAAAAPTAGTGGPTTDRLNQSFTANGITSTTHIFAAGIDPTKEVGLLLYLDGSGAYGYKNHTQNYLIDSDGAAGMRQVARDNNMILLTPLAPLPSDSDGDNCWYNETGTPNATAKADWLRKLVDKVYADYNVETERVATGGYSSGAQGLMRWFLPRHGSAVQADGVNVAISFGGAPAASAGTPTFTAAHKSNVAYHWNIGTKDTTGAYSNTAQWGGRTGANWYKNNGFQVTEEYPNIGHSRSDFAAIMRDQIAKHVRPAAAVGSTPAPTEPTEPAPVDPAPAAWDHQIAARSTGATMTVDIPADSPRVTWRMSASPITTQTGFYDYTDRKGDDVVIRTSSTLKRGTTYHYQIESGSRSNVVASGTFRTLP